MASRVPKINPGAVVAAAAGVGGMAGLGYLGYNSIYSGEASAWRQVRGGTAPLGLHAKASLGRLASWAPRRNSGCRAALARCAAFLPP